jgi:serine/threonine protein kinase
MKKRTQKRNKKGGFKFRSLKKSLRNIPKFIRKKTKKINSTNMDYFNMVKCIYNTLESKIPEESMKQFNNKKALPLLMKTLYVKRNNKLLNETYAKFIEVKDEYKKVIDAYNNSKYGNLVIGNQTKNINCKKITLDTSIGEGEFGEVYLGTLFIDNSNIKCAIKTNKSSNTYEEFKKEAKVSSSFNHKNIVKMLGFCENQKYIIYELCESSLLSYLRANINKEIDNYDNIKINWCLNIVEGMQYLTKEKFVHRDLAARNVLIDSKNNAKISDFGMTKAINEQYYFKESDSIALPIRWLAPEIYDMFKFNEKTDVWACGIVMIEIFSNGRVPYNTMNNDQVIEYVKDGNTLSCLECPKKFFKEVVSQCHKSVENRYTFENLFLVIHDFIDDEYSQIDSDNSKDINPDYQSISVSEAPNDSTYEVTTTRNIQPYSVIDSPNNNILEPKIEQAGSVNTRNNSPITRDASMINSLENLLKPTISKKVSVIQRSPNFSEELTNDSELNSALNTTLDRTFRDPSNTTSVTSIPNFYSFMKQKPE